MLGEKYVMLKPLGRGGMGSVYLAKHRVLDKMVAVKVVHLGLADNPRALRRFYDEARNAGRLEHPHNVKVFDFGHEEEGLTYLVMEIVRGRPLYSLGFPVASRRALRIMLQICGALEEAHSLGLVHRDLKPNNVMISKVDGRDFARVLDYGIAKSQSGSTSLTRSGAIIGTPEYLSPEQAAGEEVDRRSDIYSLGVMLYEMVTGKLPFQANSAMGQVYAHIHHTPSPPCDHAEITPEVNALILDCLAKKRDDRPQSVAELRARFQELLDTDILGADEDTGDTIPVRPPDLSNEAMASTISDPFTPPPSRTSPGLGPEAAEVPEPAVNPAGGTVLVDAQPTMQTQPPKRSVAVVGVVVIALIAAALLLFRLGAFTASEKQPETTTDLSTVGTVNGTTGKPDAVVLLQPQSAPLHVDQDSFAQALEVLHGAANRANTTAIRAARDLPPAGSARESDEPRPSRSRDRDRDRRDERNDEGQSERAEAEETDFHTIHPLEDEPSDTPSDRESLLERLRRENEDLIDN